jgi:hypothetical protein
VLYPLTVFLSAFLLFQIQPMIARAILPWFGGTATLWTVAVLFFQLGLLAAYAYAHVVLQALTPARQRILHLGIVVLGLLTLPVAARETFRPTGEEEPVLNILLVLVQSVGLPYFVVAATAPLLQGWYAQEADAPARPGWLPSPYVLYAVSNIGSLLALLSYPFIIEPGVGLRVQFSAWSIGYLAFAAALAVIAWPRARRAAMAAPAPEWSPRPPVASLMGALGLAAVTNTLLLAVTTTLAYNIAPVPLLWVVPLALYLLSFALPFGLPMRRLRLVLPFLAVLALVPIERVVTATSMPLPTRFVLLMPAFFAICLACHAELAHLRPHPRHLSSFYLMIALGGAVGGIVAGIVAPLVFDSHHELPLSLAASVALAVWLFGRSRGWSWRHPLVAGPVIAAVVIGASMIRDAIDEVSGNRLSTRNFYGTLAIRDEPAPDDTGPLRMLVNGSIKHGGQLVAPAHRGDPTTYYGPDSGVALAIRTAGQGGPIRVGVIGLGAGTLASYGRPGDTYVFFEINPLVIALAAKEFSFLRDSRARTEVIPGDGRRSLERYAGPPFDVLVLDAFAGDSVPVHLMTREAFDLYFTRLAPAGILAVQITNQYLDLRPVVGAAAAAPGRYAVPVSTRGQETPFYDSAWVLMTRDARRFAAPAFATARPLAIRPIAWTDDHADLLSVLKR